jgi:hypothetical protein
MKALLCDMLGSNAEASWRPLIQHTIPSSTLRNSSLMDWVLQRRSILVLAFFTWPSCFSCTSAALTATWEAATYRSNGAPDEGGVRVVKSIKYCFSSSKAFCWAGLHWKTSTDFNTSKKGRFLSADLEINMFNDVSLPANLWAPFLEFGGSIRRIGSILFRLASIPFVDTKQPRNLPFFTPKTLFWI